MRMGIDPKCLKLNEILDQISEHLTEDSPTASKRLKNSANGILSIINSHWKGENSIDVTTKICPICKNAINSLDLSNHIHMCSIELINKNLHLDLDNPTSTEDSKVNNTQIHHYDGAPEDYRIERQMDGASENYQIRNNGEFGSYPTYDNMDDESWS